MNNNKTEVVEIGCGEEYCMWYKCLNCDCFEIMNNFKYCPLCGKEIDWSNNDK